MSCLGSGITGSIDRYHFLYQFAVDRQSTDGTTITNHLYRHSEFITVYKYLKFKKSYGYMNHDRLHTDLIARSDLVQWKETPDHNITMHDERLSTGACRADSVWIGETGSSSRQDDDVTGTCAENEDQIAGRRRIHSVAFRPMLSFYAQIFNPTITKSARTETDYVSLF